MGCRPGRGLNLLLVRRVEEDLTAAPGSMRHFAVIALKVLERRTFRSRPGLQGAEPVRVHREDSIARSARARYGHPDHLLTVFLHPPADAVLRSTQTSALPARSGALP